MHDIGKSLIPEDILYSTEIYTDHERDIMNQHPELGCQLLSNILTTFKYMIIIRNLISFLTSFVIIMNGMMVRRVTPLN